MYVKKHNKYFNLKDLHIDMTFGKVIKTAIGKNTNICKFTTDNPEMKVFYQDLTDDTTLDVPYINYHVFNDLEFPKANCEYVVFHGFAKDEQEVRDAMMKCMKDHFIIEYNELQKRIDEIKEFIK